MKNKKKRITLKVHIFQKFPPFDSAPSTINIKFRLTCQVTQQPLKDSFKLFLIFLEFLYFDRPMYFKLIIIYYCSDKKLNPHGRGPRCQRPCSRSFRRVQCWRRCWRSGLFLNNCSFLIEVVDRDSGLSFVY